MCMTTLLLTLPPSLNAHLDVQMASASSTATSFLDNYLDVLKPLPTDFYRNLALMQKLDSLGERMFNLPLPPPILFEATLSS